MSQPVRATLEAARIAPIPPGSRSALLMQHGSMKLRYYAPRGTDAQTPARPGRALRDRERPRDLRRRRPARSVRPGDVLFAGAHVEHRFEGFSEDFATWVVFYGPPGGEPA